MPPMPGCYPTNTAALLLPPFCPNMAVIFAGTPTVPPTQARLPPPSHPNMAVVIDGNGGWRMAANLDNGGGQ